MPSITFNNLCEEKKKKIIEASKKEFSNKLYQEASLNQIIKESDISRGSFYMYFDDKKDLYFYLLDEYKNRFEGIVIHILNKNNGEIFSSFKEIFSMAYTKLLNDENSLFIENIFRNMNYLIESKLLTFKPKGLLEHIIYDYTNKNYLVLTKRKEILNLLHIIIMLCMNSLTKLIHNPNDLKLINDSYNEQLLLLKKSFYKGGK